MFKETGKLNPAFETDNEQFKELLDMYNAWYAETCFLSNCNWLDTNEKWKKMHEYCKEHPNILRDFWISMKMDIGEVGHFTMMLSQLFPNMVEVKEDYCPLNIIEKTWLMTLIAMKNTSEE